MFLDFHRIDLAPVDVDEKFRPPGDDEIAVHIEVSQVTGRKAALDRGGFAEVLREHRIGADDHLAEREAALLGQVLVRYVRQRNPEARARLTEELEELSRLGRRLRTAMLRQALRDELAR